MTVYDILYVTLVFCLLQIKKNYHRLKTINGFWTAVEDQRKSYQDNLQKSIIMMHIMMQMDSEQEQLRKIFKTQEFCEKNLISIMSKSSKKCEIVFQ